MMSVVDRIKVDSSCDGRRSTDELDCAVYRTELQPLCGTICQWQHVAWIRQ